jgi:outer membrane protein assembly factor BamA
MGKNQKLNISVERGQVDSMFRINYTDPWIEGDDKRTSRSITMQVVKLHTFFFRRERFCTAPIDSSFASTLAEFTHSWHYSSWYQKRINRSSPWWCDNRQVNGRS